MFKEIMKNVVDFLSVSNTLKDSFSEPYDNLSVKKYLTLGYDIPVDSIVKIEEFKISHEIPKIILVDVDYDASFRVCDYVIIDGKLCKLISINNRLTLKDEGNSIAIILTLFGDICNAIVEYYRPMIVAGMSSTASFTNALMYAPMVMTVAYLNEVSPWIKDEDIALIVKYMYKNASEATIASTRKLITEFTIEALFDNCVWYGVSNKEYPCIRCNEKFDESSNENDNYEDEWNEGLEDDQLDDEEHENEDY